MFFIKKTQSNEVIFRSYLHAMIYEVGKIVAFRHIVIIIVTNNDTSIQSKSHPR